LAWKDSLSQANVHTACDLPAITPNGDFRYIADNTFTFSDRKIERIELPAQLYT